MTFGTVIVTAPAGSVEVGSVEAGSETVTVFVTVSAPLVALPLHPATRNVRTRLPAASDAAEEDTGSTDVPNDYYIVDESNRLFTYKLPADAHVTVLADGVEGTRITVAELAKLVKGKDPLGHPLFEPLETGVWILIEADTVRAIDQQYVP